MTNGFAGSKSLDERRRRRLAQEGLEAFGLSSRTSKRRSRSSASSKSTESSQSEKSLHLSELPPIKTRLWSEPWKYAVLIASLLLFDVGIVLHTSRLWLRWEPPAAASAAEGWILEHLMFGYFGACATFAWLILYHRSSSRLDFGGRYRVWIWPAVLWTGITACSLAGWHEQFGHWLAGQTNLQGWNGSFWCWLIPSAAFLLSSTRLLTSEFSACRTAWRLHLSSVVIAAIAVFSVLLRGTSLNGAWLSPTVTLSTILWPTIELGSFLLFARHVVHVSNEPTPVVVKERKRRPSIGKLLKRLAAWLLSPREEMPAYEAAKAAPRTRRKSSAQSKKTKGASSRKSQSTSKSRRVESTEESEEESEVADEADEESLPARIEKPTATAFHARSEQQRVIPPTKFETRTNTPQAAPAKPEARSSEVVAPTRTDPPVMAAEARPAPQLRTDAAQPKRGPHFAQASQQQREREAVAAVRREPSRMEDDFGDVVDWDEEESQTRQRKRMKGKKKHRR